MIIPFFLPHFGCPHQCVFCNQKNITGARSSAAAAHVSSVIADHLATNRACGPVQVAFYGGSFTALPEETQKSYLRAVQPFIGSGQVKSIRLSTRPDAIDTKILTVLREYRVDIVELGAQSMHDAVLALSGRGHTAADTVNAVKQLRDLGFTAGLQLMPGLPGDSEDIWAETVDKTIALGPDFVRIYPAIVIKGTPLEKLFLAGKYVPLVLSEAVARCKSALLSFEKAGIEVIRIGLQQSDELRRPGTIVAGPYHPAFRQLVESSVLIDRMRAALAGRKGTSSAATFRVNPAEISTAIGQNRSNIEILKRQFGLKTIKLQPDTSILRRTVRLDSS